MNRKLVLILFLLINFQVFAQKESDVLLTVDDEPVTVGEFKYIYEKNSRDDDSLYLRKNLMEYLELFKNFKLKVHAAKEAGIDTSVSFLKEYTTYRNQLAEPYLNARETTNELVRESYDRLSEERRASHILIRVSEDAKPADTLDAYKKINALLSKIQLLNRIKSSDNPENNASFFEDYKESAPELILPEFQNADLPKVSQKLSTTDVFAEYAKQFSEDPSAKSNEGDLGFFTSFQMIYPFESTAYNIEKPGQIAGPVRTRFGYHIIRLEDIRPNRGSAEVAHIMIRTNKTMSEEEVADKREFAQLIADSLQSGSDFKAFAEKYSQDLGTAKSGGELPPFNSFSPYFPDEFKDAAFSLENPGDVSDPVKTKYGFHILKLIEKTPLESFEEKKVYLEKKVKRDVRADKSKQAALAQFKDENKFKEKTKRLEWIKEIVDSSLLDNTWKYSGLDKGDKWLIKIDGEKYPLDDFANYLEKKQDSIKTKNLDYKFDKIYEYYVENRLISYEDEHLTEKYPEFRNLAREYKEGIMLFEISEKEIWFRASTDSSGLETFYNENMKDYYYPIRLNVCIANCKNAKVQNQAYLLMQNPEIDRDSLLIELKKLDGVEIRNGKFPIEDDQVLTRVPDERGVHKVDINTELYMVKVYEKLKPSPRPLEEIRGLVVADYQIHLENEWMNDLKEKYPITINEDILEKLVE